MYLLVTLEATPADSHQHNPQTPSERRDTIEHAKLCS